MSEIRSRWTRLGYAFAMAPAEEPAELEATIVSSLPLVRDDARLFVGIATWLHRYGGLVDGHLLARALSGQGPREKALLGALFAASSCPGLRGWQARWDPLPEEEILFSVMARNRVLRSKVEAGSLPRFRKWGFLVDEFALKPAALRPPSWVLRMNPELKLRAVLGPGLRAEVVSHLLRHGPADSVSALSRSLGRPYPTVHAAVSGLLALGQLSATTRGRSTAVEVPRDIAEWIDSFPGAQRAAERVDRAGAA
jgi:hypothetical protein